MAGTNPVHALIDADLFDKFTTILDRKNLTKKEALTVLITNFVEQEETNKNKVIRRNQKGQNDD